ncbi:hypothetical protein PQE71_gp049 [Bacillus phage Izhevsk]|uniref:Uncharacterized protein n=1 Tax=Bacillus phage Izhevsk TaxID=2724322 RepID=A0A6H0X5Y4_9CAUD|nr:hypothetical protein PQE71_gp049 [Bacillus phage Izhevsk]QIW89731.1 hypothetical protein Izhevsk_49 [Bacillus phage Izhevsk]
MAYDYKSKDGLCESNNKNFVDTWNNVVDDYNKNERRWIEDLKLQGVKASHPDDGWVDRIGNKVFLQYPQFNNYPEVGDTIALGWASKYRLVKVVKIEEMYLGLKPRYAFEPIETDEPKEEKKANWFIRLLFGE